MRCRCDWVDLNRPYDVIYHDTEWGVPVHDDPTLFEFLVLESAQAGLSWTTILSKRAGYRHAFDQFDPAIIACYDEEKIQALLQDADIVRNRLKILATINNARCFLAIGAEFGSFDAYVWRFVGGQPRVNLWRTQAECPTTTPESHALSADLKQRGFKFMGPTTCYAYMQAMGLVDDHLLGCFRRAN